jgi:hypothetical protein
MGIRNYLINEQEFEVKNLHGKVLKTKIKPKDRTYKNIPKYSDGKNRVDFKEWLQIKGEGGGKNSNETIRPHTYGKSYANGKWYGWSHRAIYGFAIGDKIKGDVLAKQKESDPDFIIKTENDAKKAAITFANNVG